MAKQTAKQPAGNVQPATPPAFELAPVKYANLAQSKVTVVDDDDNLFYLDPVKPGLYMLRPVPRVV